MLKLLVKKAAKTEEETINEQTVSVLIKAIKDSMGKKEAEDVNAMSADETGGEARDSFFDSRIPGIMESPTEDPADR